jgi:Transposase domain (DUF772)
VTKESRSSSRPATSIRANRLRPALCALGQRAGRPRAGAPAVARDGGNYSALRQGRAALDLRSRVWWDRPRAGVCHPNTRARALHGPRRRVACYPANCGVTVARVIERECVEDVAYRVIAANQRPDHTTIARFRQRHETALADLFGQVLGLCAQAGLVKAGVIAIDGTKVHANASQHAARRSPGRSLARLWRPTGSRTSSMGASAATSCRLSFPQSRAGGAGCVRLNVASMRNVPPRPSQSRVRALSAFGNQNADWRRNSLSSAPRTRLMRPTVRAG